MRLASRTRNRFTQEMRDSMLEKAGRPLGVVFVAVAVLAGCRARKASEIDRAPRANPTIPAGRPALKPDSSTAPSDTAPPKP